jgi:hypothetical protein
MNIKQYFVDSGYLIKGFFLVFALTFFMEIGYCQKPEFSGEYVLNIDKSKLQATWTAGLTKGDLKIVYHEPNFSFWRNFTINGKEKITSYALVTNGQPQKGEHKTIWTLTWKQDTLSVLVTRKSMINEVKYYFTANGDFVADEHFEDYKTSYHNHWVFDKRSPVTKKE